MTINNATISIIDRSCFALPSSQEIDFTVKNQGRTGAIVHITEPTISTACQGISFPLIEYQVYFKRKDSEKVRHSSSFTSTIQVEDGVLDKDTELVHISSFTHQNVSYFQLRSFCIMDESIFGCNWCE